MAASDPVHAGLSAEELQHERYITAMCRNARLQNTELYKKRERLRHEVNGIQREFYDLEAEYWHMYHSRVAGISTAESNGPTRNWISAFGEKERQLVDDLAKRQDKLREEARLKQEELAAVDREFWDAWRKHVDFMRGLTPLPPSSGSTRAAPPQPADNKKSSPFPSNHSGGEIGQGGSILHPASGHKRDVTLNPQAKQFMMPGHTPAPAVAGFLQAPAIGAVQSAQSARPSIELTPSSSVSLQHSAGFETRSDAPSPEYLNPKNAPADSENQGESSQERADDLQPAKPHKAAAAASQSVNTSAAVNPAKPAPPVLPKLMTQQNQNDGFVGVTDPVVGEIYRGFYKDDECSGWWYCTPLPWDDWGFEIGIWFNFQDTDLFRDLPECYTADRVPANPRRTKKKSRRTKKVITGWKKGFENGGPRVRERVFPVLFFDDEPGKPGYFNFPASPTKSFTFTRAALLELPVEWIAASDLRLPDTFVGCPVRGRDMAGRFKERIRGREALKAQGMLGARRRANIGSSSAVEASSPVEGDTTREDTEMADAESLSGATAVDETSVQPEALEAPKTPSPPTAKIFSSGPDME